MWVQELYVFICQDFLWELRVFLEELDMLKWFAYLQESHNDFGMRHNMDVQPSLKDRQYHPRNRVMTANRKHVNISFSCLYWTKHVVYAVCCFHNTQLYMSGHDWTITERKNAVLKSNIALAGPWCYSLSNNYCRAVPRVWAVLLKAACFNKLS